MADDSWDIEQTTDFHPCDKPHGANEYVLNYLTSSQQSELNKRKIDQIRTDQKYLSNHPEIRALIVLILRNLMKTRPKYDVYEAVGAYFTKSSIDLKAEVAEYLRERDEILVADGKKLASSREMMVSLLTADSDLEPDFGDETKHWVSKVDVDRRSDEEEEDLVVSYKEPSATGLDAKKSDMLGGDEEATLRAVFEVIDVILDHVMTEVDVPSIASITSGGFLVDYVDHDIASESSSDSDDGPKIIRKKK